MNGADLVFISKVAAAIHPQNGATKSDFFNPSFTVVGSGFTRSCCMMFSDSHVLANLVMNTFHSPLKPTSNGCSSPVQVAGINKIKSLGYLYQQKVRKGSCNKQVTRNIRSERHIKEQTNDQPNKTRGTHLNLSLASKALSR